MSREISRYQRRSTSHPPLRALAGEGEGSMLPILSRAKCGDGRSAQTVIADFAGTRSGHASRELNSKSAAERGNGTCWVDRDKARRLSSPAERKRSGGGGPREAWWRGRAAQRLTSLPTPLPPPFGRSPFPASRGRMKRVSAQPDMKRTLLGYRLRPEPTYGLGHQTNRNGNSASLPRRIFSIRVWPSFPSECVARSR